MPGDEIMSSYVAKLEEEIDGLKAKNKELSKRPRSQFTGGAVDEIAGWTFGFSIFAIIVFFLGWMIFTHGTTGNYYIEYTTQRHSKMVHKEKCIEEVVTLKPCYQVMSEYNWGADDGVGTCFDTAEEARTLVDEVASGFKTLEKE